MSYGNKMERDWKDVTRIKMMSKMKDNVDKSLQWQG